MFLDTGILGMVTHPKGGEDAKDCAMWLESLLEQNHAVCIPEICDYELRRELIRANRQNALKRLDSLKATLEYLPITTSVMLEASKLWAEARKMGRPTAGDKALDGDMILSAQVRVYANGEGNAIIATTNVGHLSLFTKANHWNQISP